MPWSYGIINLNKYYVYIGRDVIVEVRRNLQDCERTDFGFMKESIMLNK